MNVMDSLQFWANIAQLISVAIALLALGIQIYAWHYPTPPSIQPIIQQIRPWLPYISTAAIFFLIGAQTLGAKVSEKTVLSIQVHAKETTNAEIQPTINFLLATASPITVRSTFTSTPIPQVTSTTTPTPNLVATSEMEQNRIKSAVAATLAVQTISVSTTTPYPSPTLFDTGFTTFIRQQKDKKGLLLLNFRVRNAAKS